MASTVRRTFLTVACIKIGLEIKKKSAGSRPERDMTGFRMWNTFCRSCGQLNDFKICFFSNVCSVAIYLNL